MRTIKSYIFYIFGLAGIVAGIGGNNTPLFLTGAFVIWVAAGEHYKEKNEEEK